MTASATTATRTRTITGAVLEELGRERPYAVSKPITVSELELDGPGPDELLVRIEAAGVCHSDLSVVDGNRPRPVPMLLGHEAAGIVEAVGAAASAAGYSVGDRVVTAFLPRCGDCDGCRTGGVMPCVPGTAANTAGTLFDGGIRLHRDGEPVHHTSASRGSRRTRSSTGARRWSSGPTCRRMSRRCSAAPCSPAAAPS